MAITPPNTDATGPKVKAAEQQYRETFFSVVGQHLERLYHFVRHELAYFEAIGDLAPTDLTPEDVVDTAVLRAYGEFVREPRIGRSIRGRLIRHAREYIEAEARRRSVERARTVSLEQDIPDVPPEEWVTTLGEEREYFYQPDEDLKLEDLVPDFDVPPPDDANRTEVERCVGRALAAMQRSWRWALLFYADGLRGAELADAVGKPEPETRRILDEARRYLRTQLINAGCVPKPERSQ